MQGGIATSIQCGLVAAGMIFADEANIADYTARALLDPRTENKVLRIAPPSNTFWSQNQIVDLYEKLSGTRVQRVPVSPDQMRQAIDGTFLRYCAAVALLVGCLQSSAYMMSSWADTSSLRVRTAFSMAVHRHTKCRLPVAKCHTVSTKSIVFGNIAVSYRSKERIQVSSIGPLIGCSVSVKQLIG